MTLTPHQRQAFESLQAFCRAKTPGAAILKGYAGTGKTTLVGALVMWLRSEGKNPVLLASTGRAAKILQDKAQHPARTIHSHIYAFDGLGGLESTSNPTPSGQQISLDFSLKTPNTTLKDPVYIVDEASMISHEMADGRGSATRFGSGSLLDDLMQFAAHAKILFVGDPCQLPPVAENPFSSALDAPFLRQRYQVPVTSVELSEIIRQQSGSEILRLAGVFRERIVQNRFEKWAKIPLPGGNQTHLLPSENALVEAYLKSMQSTDGYQQAIMIASTNKQCHALNSYFRQTRHGKQEVQPGELLMVVQNSYLVPLVNGDQVVVENVAEFERRAGFTFLSATIRPLHSNEVYETLMLKELLYNENASLSKEEQQRLLIDFDTRARHAGLKRNTDGYLKAMQSDMYLNALRAKFGYALTCHKSQGGEWPTVFLNIHKSLYGGFKDASLYRWYYTALTRAREHLYVNDDWWVEGYNARHPEKNKW